MEPGTAPVLANPFRAQQAKQAAGSRPGMRFRMRVWKGIGSAAAITAFALLLPLSSPIMVSCSSDNNQTEKKMEESAEEAEKLFSLSEEYSQSSLAYQVAHAMDCRELVPYKRGPFAGYFSPYGLIISAPGITAEKCLNEEGGFEEVNVDRLTRRKLKYTGEVLEYRGWPFDARGFDCITNTLRSMGVKYRLLYNSCSFDMGDDYSSASLLFPNLREYNKYDLFGTNFLCFFLPSDVVILMPNYYERNDYVNPPAQLSGIKENVFYRAAGPSKFKRWWGKHGEDVENTVGLIAAPFILTTVTEMTPMETAGWLIAGQAADMVVRAANERDKYEGRRKTLGQIEETIPVGVRQVARQILDTGSQVNILFSFEQIGMGYRQGAISVSDYILDSYAAPQLTFVDEGLLIHHKTKDNKGMIGYYTFEYNRCQHWEFKCGPDSWQRMTSFYDYENFSRIKAGLEILGLGYALSYCPQSGELIFVAKADQPVFVRLARSHFSSS